METIVVKVDNKKNLAFLQKLLHKFNFVVEVKTGTSAKARRDLENVKNVAGKLRQYADLNKLKEEQSIWNKVAKDKHGTY